jgi:hypothetical protein
MILVFKSTVTVLPAADPAQPTASSPDSTTIIMSLSYSLELPEESLNMISTPYDPTPSAPAGKKADTLEPVTVVSLPGTLLNVPTSLKATSVAPDRSRGL